MAYWRYPVLFLLPGIAVFGTIIVASAVPSVWLFTRNSSADEADSEGVPGGVERRTDRITDRMHDTGALRLAAHGCAVIKLASAHA
ncbi:hypothetical protein [Verminephrobacter eiseniae]|uniref:hypothetical protein n=1 Tax=Verminephrobacter eiseniae TaxID=364317 RepID=UPI0022374693|nr:hypothetical protein [Verminephrobacter eiseniae]MCW5237823.1 hypothetical protein [Verminephrobacter eiseniae]